MTTDSVKSRSAAGKRVLTLPDDEPPARRDEILDTASRLFADTGMRTSLQEIADACGIRPGSLYHHFDSKEDIVVALIERYHADLDQLAARATAELGAAEPAESLDLLMALGDGIARIGERHGAAVQFTFYEPPAGSDAALVRLASRKPKAVIAAIAETGRVAQSAGLIRPGVAVDFLAQRICQTMLSVGTGLFGGQPIDRVVGVLNTIFVSGLAVDAPSDAELDRSDAMRAVRQVIATWVDDEDAPDDRGALIRNAARTEFGRRGYEVTTVREIAAAAGVSTGAVYRVIGSKEELLVAIATTFQQKVMMGWSAALTSQSTAVEKVDALIWLQINVMERFFDEFKTQLAWLRHSPPETAMFGWSFQTAARALGSLVTEGVKAGELRRLNASGDLAARCLLALSWMHEDSARSMGNLQALAAARDCVLRGAATVA